MSDWVKVGARAAVIRPSRLVANEFAGYVTIVRLTATQIITSDAEDREQKWRRKDCLEMRGDVETWRRHKLVPADDTQVWRSLHYQKIMDTVGELNRTIRDSVLMGSNVPHLIVSTRAILLAAMKANKALRDIYDKEQENRGS